MSKEHLIGIRPLGVVGKVEFEPKVHSVWLKRNEDVLLQEEQWEWTEKEWEAYIFDSPEPESSGFMLAEAAADQLRANGEKLVFPLVHGTIREAAMKEAMAAYHKHHASSASEDWKARHQAMLERMGID